MLFVKNYLLHSESNLFVIFYLLIDKFYRKNAKKSRAQFLAALFA